jgi:mannose-6-phosphate isomerase-like protein (cupin superfamily)
MTTEATRPSFHLTPAQGTARMPGPDRDQYDILLRHGTVEVGFYAPRGVDDQAPHDRDEAYIVISGTGWFVNGPERHRFSPGDLLFVPRGVVHRFEEFSADLALWVLFWD